MDTPTSQQEIPEKFQKRLSPKAFDALSDSEKLTYLYIHGDPFQRWVFGNFIRRFGVGTLGWIALLYGTGQAIEWIFHLVVTHIVVK